MSYNDHRDYNLHNDHDDNIRMFHAFNYYLSHLMGMAEDISKQGFNYVLIQSLQPYKTENLPRWCAPYQPTGLSIGNDYGSMFELEKLCRHFESYGIGIVLDAVINHMAGITSKDIPPSNFDPTQWFLSKNPVPYWYVDEKLRSNPHFWKNGGEISDWNNRDQVINASIPGLPGLKLDNYELQDLINSEFFQPAINCGVQGFRIDAAKNTALPDEFLSNRSNCHFFPRVIKPIVDNGIIVFAEVLNSDEKLTKRYINEGMKVITDRGDFWLPELLKYPESHDSYLSPEIANTPAGTRRYNTDEINSRYRELAEKSNHILYYTRPFDDRSWRLDIIQQANFINEAKGKERTLAKRIA